MKRYFSLSEAWVEELDAAHWGGDIVIPRGMATRELRFRSFTIEDPLTLPIRAQGRGFVDVIGILEGLSLVGQVSVPEVFTDRITKFKEFTDAGVFHGAYGARAHGRLIDIVDTLVKDHDSRQAVLPIFEARDLNAAKRDIPCTVCIQFMIRDGALEMGVTMRSNDVWLGLPYDLTQFAILQASLAQALGVAVGPYTHMAGSLHLYDRDISKAGLVVAPDDAESMAFPLWSGVTEEMSPVAKLAAISARARSLLLTPGSTAALTDFEEWAQMALLR